MILFLESDKNPFSITLNTPLVGVSQVKLLSCSLYNSWYNLIGGIVMTKNGSNKIPDSHYTPVSLSAELAKHGYTLTTGLPHEMAIRHNITNFTAPVGILGTLLGVKQITTTATPVHWKVPNPYTIHCNLVQSYDNEKKSDILAKVNPIGKPFDLVEYFPKLHYKSDTIVSTISIDVSDGLDFNERKLQFVLEII